MTTSGTTSAPAPAPIPAGERVSSPVAHVVVTPVDDRIVLYDPHQHLAHLLNPSAAAVWRSIDGRVPDASVAEHVANRFDVEVGLVAHDVSRTLGELGELGLIVDVNDPPTPSEPRPDNATVMATHYNIAPVRSTRSDRPSGRWAHESPTYRALDLRFAIVGDTPAIARYLAEVLEPLRVDGPPDLWYAFEHRRGDLDHFDLSIGSHPRVAGILGASDLVSRLLWDYNHRAIATATADSLFHASAVSTPAGVIAFPAPADSGKSTLVTALVRHGYGYVTDECLAVRCHDLSVVTYPKPIGLDPGSFPLFIDAIDAIDADDSLEPTKRWLDAASIGPATRAPHPAVGERLPLGALVFASYQPSTTGGSVAIDRAETVVRLARNTFRLADRPGEGMAYIADLAGALPAYELPVDDLDRACAALDAMVDDLHG